MRASVAAVAGVALLVGTVLSACDSTATGTPTPQSDVSDSPEPTGSESSSPESDGLVPPIENPKNLKGLDPCQLLTQAQLAELTISEPGVADMSQWGEKQCIWQNSVVSVGFSPETTLGGLEQAYRNKDAFDNFEESSVDGYPAARTDFATAFCSVIVGVADDQSLTVHYGRVSSKAPGLNDPCGFAEQVAGMVLENLPAA